MSKMATVEAAHMRLILDLVLRTDLMSRSIVRDTEREAFYHLSAGLVNAREPEPVVSGPPMATYLGLSTFGSEKIPVIKVYRQFYQDSDHIDPTTGYPLRPGLREAKTWAEGKGHKIPIELGRLLADIRGEFNLPYGSLVQFPQGYDNWGWPLR